MREQGEGLLSEKEEERFLASIDHIEALAVAIVIIDHAAKRLDSEWPEYLM